MQASFKERKGKWEELKTSTDINVTSNSRPTEFAATSFAWYNVQKEKQKNGI